MRLKIVNIIVVFILMMLNIHCTSRDSSDDTNDIYSLIIDKTIKPIPPPPPPKLTDSVSTIPKRVVDSISKLKLNIAISSDLMNLSGLPPNINEFENFKSIIKELYNTKKSKLVLNLSTTKKGHRLTFIDSEKIEKSQIFKKFDVFVSLADVKFSSKKNYAVTALGKSYGKLSGTVYLFFLEKKDGKWKIIYSKVISFA